MTTPADLLDFGHMTAGEVRSLVALPPSVDGKSEAALQSATDRFARNLGLLFYHTHDSRRSRAGFPDNVTVAGRTLIVSENKKNGGKLIEYQREWLDALAALDCVTVFTEPITVAEHGYTRWALAVLMGLAMARDQGGRLVDLAVSAGFGALLSPAMSLVLPMTTDEFGNLPELRRR